MYHADKESTAYNIHLRLERIVDEMEFKLATMRAKSIGTSDELKVEKAAKFELLEKLSRADSSIKAANMSIGELRAALEVAKKDNVVLESKVNTIMCLL